MMSLRDLYVADDAREILDHELDEELKARWSRLCRDLMGQGFMLEASTTHALWNPWFFLVDAHYDPSRPRTVRVEATPVEA